MRDILAEGNLLLLALTETWLRDQLDAEIAIESYTIFRSDRQRPKKRRGRNSGGVAAYIRNDLASSTEVVMRYSDGIIDALCLNIRRLNTYFFVVYRPPNDPLGGNISSSTELSACLNEISSIIENLPTPTPNIVITGDFNLPRVDWVGCCPTPGATPSERDMYLLISDFSIRHFLKQLVHKPTHKAGNTLDLLFANCPEVFINTNISPATPYSSHYTLEFVTIFPYQIPTEAQSQNDTNPFDQINLFNEETNWNSIGDTLGSIDWVAIFRGKSATEMINIFLRICMKCAMENSPPKVILSKSKNHVPRHRKTLMRRRIKLKKRLYTATNQQRIQSLKTKLAEIERDLQKSYKSQETHLEDKAVKSIKSNPKYFYAYAKKRQKLRTQIGPLTNMEGNLTDDPIEMANLLSKQFRSVFSTPMQVQPRRPSEDPAAPVLDDIIFGEEDFVRAIGEVSARSASGPDRFPALLLRNCKVILAKPLYIIWRESLDSGDVPQLVKESVIAPIYKGGEKNLANNYRPIALTSHLVKIFEKIIRNSLVPYIEATNNFNPNQHGFRAGRSCLSQLISHYDKITTALELGESVDVIYLDFAKAFDKLDIDICLQKLETMGVKGKLLRWIRGLISGRTQTVNVNGARSGAEEVLSGVPQGSVLGPLLFLLMLVDIDEGILTSSVSSFADDTRVLGSVSNLQDVDNLQADLNTIYLWALNNNAQFNGNKFECLRYGDNNNLRNSTSYKSSTGSVITVKDSVRDLGVEMATDASFKSHIRNIAVTANMKCGWILRTFKSRDQNLMITLWKSLVLPILDYCCQLWSPGKVGQIQTLENVQLAYLRKISGIAHLNYWEQLKYLGLYSLQRRRERYISLYVWKVLEGIVPDFGVSAAVSGRRGRSCVVPHVRPSAPTRIQNLRFSSLAISGPRLFNALPAHIRDMKECSVDVFKRALDKYLTTIPDEPRVKRLVPYCRFSSNSIIDMKPTTR